MSDMSWVTFWVLAAAGISTAVGSITTRILRKRAQRQLVLRRLKAVCHD